MKKAKRSIAGRLLGSVLLAGELCVLADIAFTLADWLNSGFRLAALFTALFTLLFLLRLPDRLRWFCAAALPAVCALLIAAGVLLWRAFLPGAVYRQVDQGKAALYAGKKVMLLVPHEDDDQNLMAGVLEEYVRYGSQVYAVFLTNGDKGLAGPGRMQESVHVMESLGVPEEHVIFLGYGDQWAQGSPHIYNAGPDEPMTSAAGYTETYGIEGHPAYHDGNPYTRRHLLEDLESVLQELRPEVIFACDLDDHLDHKACSLFFEEALGQVLAQSPDYRPLVLKGFAYSTSYYNPNDFYRLNMASTLNPYGTEHMKENNFYRWSDRIRLPVAASTLSRSMENAGTYLTLKLYPLQYGVLDQAFGIINADKVYWFRPTGSLSYTAQVSASSGQAERLKDFKLADSEDLLSWGPPYDGAWVPEPGDTERSAVLTLDREADLVCLRLYDNPSEEDNVLDALIRFDDGTELHTGPLDPMGTATEISMAKKSVHSLTVRLLETEGERAGLTELEVYDRQPDPDLRFIKLQDAEGSFAYDYYTPLNGRASFRLYAMGAPAELTEENYRVSVQGEGCTARIEDGTLQVSCPFLRSCVVTVESADGSLSDSVLISNPGFIRRLGQPMEVFWRYELPKLCHTTLRIKLQMLIEKTGLF